MIDMGDYTKISCALDGHRAKERGISSTKSHRSTVQNKEPQQFRLNSQAVIIVAITLIALAIPLAMVMFYLQGVAGKRTDIGVEEISKPLEAKLEILAEDALAPSALDVNQPHIRILTDEPEKMLERVKTVLESFDASVLPPAREGETTRLLASLPTSRVKVLQAALRRDRDGAPPDQPHPSETNRIVIDDTTTLVEIVIQTKRSP